MITTVAFFYRNKETDTLTFPLDNYSAMIQLMAGAGVAVVGTVLIPLLNGLFST